MNTNSPTLVLCLVVTVFAAVWDHRSGRIPNWLTMAALLFAPAIHGVLAFHAGKDAVGLAVATSLGGAAVCAAAPLLFFRYGLVGGGDVKLIAAIGALVGPLLGIEATFWAFVIAGVLGAFRLTWRGVLAHTLTRLAMVAAARLFYAAKRLVLRKGGTTKVPNLEMPIGMAEPIRFGPAALAGVVMCLLSHGGLS